MSNSWSQKTDAYLRHFDLLLEAMLGSEQVSTQVKKSGEELAWLCLCEVWRCLLSELAEYYGKKKVAVRDLVSLEALIRAPELEYLKNQKAQPDSWVRVVELRSQEVGARTASPVPVEEQQQALHAIPLKSIGAISSGDSVEAIGRELRDYIAVIRVNQAEW